MGANFDALKAPTPSWTPPTATAPAAAPAASASQAPAAGTDGGMTPAQRASIHSAAQQFEAVFITQMLQPMFATVGTDPMFGGGSGEDTFRSVLLDEYGKQVAASGGFGISAAVEAEMIRMQKGKST